MSHPGHILQHSGTSEVISYANLTAAGFYCVFLAADGKFSDSDCKILTFCCAKIGVPVSGKLQNGVCTEIACGLGEIPEAHNKI